MQYSRRVAWRLHGLNIGIADLSVPESDVAMQICVECHKQAPIQYIIKDVADMTRRIRNEIQI